MASPLSLAGPSVPPHLAARSLPVVKECPKVNVDEDSDSEDDQYMPALPPTHQAIGPSRPAPSIGPSLPPGFSRSERSASVSENEEDDDDEDLAGPAPLPAHLASRVGQDSDGVLALREREERQREMDRIERESKLLKREEWMLLPPKELDLQASVDPTKIKSRGFKQTSKPHSSSTTDRQSGAGSLWTETPAERAERLADEAMGKRRRAEDVSKCDPDEDLEQAKRRKRDRLMREQVDQHNKSARNASLLELHSLATSNVTKSKSKADLESERKQAVVWDHDSMMGVSGKLMGEKQKADMIRDAKGLGGRFGGGSFL